MSNETTKLKQFVGDGGAGHDESHGSDTLRDVVAALIDGCPPFLSFVDAAVAVATPAQAVVERTGRYDVVLHLDVGTTGTAGQTDIEATLDGTTIAGSGLSVLNTDPDGTAVRSEVQNVLLTRGQLIAINVTAADASAANAVYTLYLKPARAE